MNGRLYDAKLHRFLQPDNYVQDPYNTQNYNRYGYVLNNPLKYTDPSGELTWSDLAAVASIVAGVVVVIASGGTLTPLAQGLIGSGVTHFLASFSIYASNGYKDWDAASNYVGFQSPTVDINLGWGDSKPKKTGIYEGESTIKPKSDGSGGDKNNESYDSWVFRDQYFEVESSLRAGTYIDFSPVKKLLGITLGEYREEGYNANYYDYKGNITKIQNHYFEAGFAFGFGANYKYNIKENRFESFSLSYFGISAEYSKQSFYGRQFYIGVDSGFSIGAGIGGGYKF